MDLLKELQDLRKAIQDALEDGRLRPLEIVRIAKEIADILQIVAPILFGLADAAEAKSKED